METKLEAEVESVPTWNSGDKKQEPGLMTLQIPMARSINVSGDQFDKTIVLSGVFCNGVQYYDMKHVQFINNTGLANLIDLLKSLLREGKTVQFVNVNEKVKKKIKAMGLENVLNCS